MARYAIRQVTSVRTLQDLGLGENEAVLYQEMLAHPRSTVRALVTRAPFPRTMLYHVLNQLVRRGLASAQKEGRRTVYVAENPERLNDLLAEKEREFEHEASALRILIPKLKNQYRLAGRRPDVRVFDGIEEYQKALEDMIISAPSMILSYEKLDGKKPAAEARDAHDRKRVARKIRKNVLFSDEEDAVKNLIRRKYDDFTQFRSVQKGALAPLEADLTLYDGKLLYTSYYDEHEPTAVLIEDQALYRMQKSLFESLWAKAKDRTLAYTEKP